MTIKRVSTHESIKSEQEAKLLDTKKNNNKSSNNLLNKKRQVVDY